MVYSCMYIVVYIVEHYGIVLYFLVFFVSYCILLHIFVCFFSFLYIILFFADYCILLYIIEFSLYILADYSIL